MKRALQFGSVLLLLALSLGLVEAQFHLLRRLLGGRPLRQRELATQYLGQYLASHYAGKRAIVWSNPFASRAGQPREVYEYEQAGLRGLQRGLGTAVKIEQVVLPELKPGALENPRAVMSNRSSQTPLSYLVADDALDRAAAQHPGAELVVSLIGLPANVRQTAIWKAEDARKFGLLLPDLRMVGEQAAIRQAIQSRKLAALVLTKPGAPPEDRPLGTDLQTEFDQRFLLVTPETVDQYLRAYPRLF